jgi:hypothetical protein
MQIDIPLKYEFDKKLFCEEQVEIFFGIIKAFKEMSILKSQNIVTYHTCFEPNALSKHKKEQSFCFEIYYEFHSAYMGTRKNIVSRIVCFLEPSYTRNKNKICVLENICDPHLNPKDVSFYCFENLWYGISCVKKSFPMTQEDYVNIFKIWLHVKRENRNVELICSEMKYQKLLYEEMLQDRMVYDNILIPCMANVFVKHEEENTCSKKCLLRFTLSEPIIFKTIQDIGHDDYVQTFMKKMFK